MVSQTATAANAAMDSRVASIVLRSLRSLTNGPSTLRVKIEARRSAARVAPGPVPAG